MRKNDYFLMSNKKHVNTPIMDKTPTHALFTQHYISLAC